MSTDVGVLDWRQDSPWRRLPWTLPSAMLACAMILWALASFMERPTHQPPEPPPIDAQVIELSSPAPAAQRERESPRPPPRPIRQLKPEPVVPMSKAVPTEAEPVKLVEQKTPPPAAAPTLPMPAPPAPPVLPPQAVSPSSNAMSGNRGAQAIVRPMPQIPDDLRDEALEATAVARFRVGLDGSATVDLTKPTLNPRLNHLLLNTLKNWRFFPAMKDGKPVASMEVIVIHIQVK
jgi:periplasmic protein TonB